MSGLFKSIGKIFKKVAKTVKKVALPVLAVGAVALTGGAALGVSLPSLSGALGATGTLGTILSTASQGATFGFAGSLLSGKNPIKAAAKGFLAGGVLGGASAALGGITPGGPVSGDATATRTGGMINGTNLPSVDGSVQAGVDAVDLATRETLSAATGSPVAQSVGGLAVQGATAPGAHGTGGPIGWAERNPILAGQVIQGIGGGILAREQEKADARRQRKIQESYEGLDGLWLGSAAGSQGGGYSKVYWEPTEGRLKQMEA